ncbi:MAG: hypothetical protein ACK4F0_08600, partial [Candidatus Ratteibacteria bacterium]
MKNELKNRKEEINQVIKAIEEGIKEGIEKEKKYKTNGSIITLEYGNTKKIYYEQDFTGCGWVNIRFLRSKENNKKLLKILKYLQKNNTFKLKLWKDYFAGYRFTVLDRGYSNGRIAQ